MIDLDHLESLAKAAGADAWTPTHATTTSLATVWLPDGDSVCRCYGNIGHQPEAIDADDVAEFIAAANPLAILDLCAEVRRLREAESLVLDYVEGLLLNDMQKAGGATARMTDHAMKRIASMKENP
jgi:hypothetical protein